MDDLERNLGDIRMAPYFVKAMALIGVRRRAGSNMFRELTDLVESRARMVRVMALEAPS